MGTQNATCHRYLYESECCSVSSFSFENFHIFYLGFAKNTFTICNVRRQKPRDPTNIRKSFNKRTTLTGVLHRRIRKRSELFLPICLIKQILQLVDGFHDSKSYPIYIAVDECYVYLKSQTCFHLSDSHFQ